MKVLFEMRGHEVNSNAVKTILVNFLQLFYVLFVLYSFGLMIKEIKIPDVTE